MPTTKRKFLIEITEKNYPKGDAAMGVIGAYKATHRDKCPTNLDALLAILHEWEEITRQRLGV